MTAFSWKGKYGAVYGTGSDPEIFVMDATGKLIPAFKALPKGTPSFYADGFAFEANVSYASCHYDVADNVKLFIAAASWQGTPTLQNVVEISPEEMAGYSDLEIRLGCTPSFNAYGMQGDLADGRSLLWRSAGGHVHLGINRALPVSRIIADEIAKTCDALAGLVGVCMARNFDKPIRRRHYGLAGEYRLPAHGFEYRTLSNWWLIAPSAAHIAFDLTREAATLGEAGLRRLLELNEGEVMECINFCDVSRAEKLLENHSAIHSIVAAKYNHSIPFHQTQFCKALKEGIDSIFDAKTIVNNWATSRRGWVELERGQVRTLSSM